jgi:hypothetical protein
MWGKCMITKNQRGTWHVHLWNGCESYRLCLPFIFIRWMQDWVSHYCDKMMFFVRVPFIQMCTVINISLDLLIETWIKTTISLWKQLCGHLLIKKTHSMDFWNWKMWIGRPIGPSQNEIFFDSHSKFVIAIQFIM